MKSDNRIICTPSDSRNIRGEHISSIDTPGVNKDIWSVIHTTSNVPSCTDNVEKFDTLVHSSTTQERNLEQSCIKEVGVKIIFPELGKDPEPSVRLNLANSVLRESPKFITLGQPSVLNFGLLRRTDFARFACTLGSGSFPSYGEILFTLTS